MSGPEATAAPRLSEDTARPVVAPSGVEPDPVAVSPGDQAVAVVLDLVDPCRAAGSLLGWGR